MDPEQVVQEQIDALNARDLDRFMACYSPDAVVLRGTDTVIYRGVDEIRAGFAGLFSQSPDVHIDVSTRITVGSWVVDEVNGRGFNFDGVPPEPHEAAV